MELKQNKDFLALEEQEKEKERLESEVQSCRNDKNELMRSVRKAVDNAKKLLGVSDADPCIRRYSEALKQIEHCQDIAEIKELTSKVIEYKQSMSEKIHRKMAEIQVEIQKYQTERNEARKELKNWKRKN